MIDAALLLKDLQGELGRLSADLLAHVKEDPDVRARLEGEWRKAFDAQRTGRTFEDWLDDRLTQVAVAWLLAFVFVRFCEDNGLIDEARIAGVGVRGGEARDAQQRFFVQHPHASDRDYLHEVFRSAAQLRGLDGVVGEGESPLWLVDPPADAVTRVLALFRSADEDGDLIHDFTDPELSTRFLGDLYQDLSEHAKSTYALLQTPEFVEEFILDRTLDPAIQTFGLVNTTMIDPTCGSGHFLLGGFRRIFEAWRTAEPGVSAREHAERALKAVTGVDLNPFAASIARFRLVVAALVASGERRLADAPLLEPDVAVGDSLLWGARSGQLAGMELAATSAERQFLYATEHADRLRPIFDRQYSAVVGNPPYIIARDPALNAQYRERFPLACSGKYSLAAPFMQRFFELAERPDGMGRNAGFVGTITANSFMKREFGKKLIERLMPRWDLSHVVDVSGAYIPGHATPTIILFGRNQAPSSATVRAVMGIRGEPSVPAQAADGLVWTDVVRLIDHPGRATTYVSVTDLDRTRLSRHPWSIGGGGASELKELLDQVGRPLREELDGPVGFGGVCGADEVMHAPAAIVKRHGLQGNSRPIVDGGVVRDWGVSPEAVSFFPYRDFELVDVQADRAWHRRLWGFRAYLWSRATFSKKTYQDEGRPWWEWHQVSLQRLASRRRITFASIATHNHFALLEEDYAFKQSAPLVILVSEEDHSYLGVLGLLNSSLACFWLKQVCACKGNGGIGGGIKGNVWDRGWDFDGTKLGKFPMSPRRPVETADALQRTSKKLAEIRPESLLATRSVTAMDLSVAESTSASLRSELVALQEALDWEVYANYGLIDQGDLARGNGDEPIVPGERAFEIVVARRAAAGELQTAWFSRHGITPVTDLPSRWSEEYRAVVERRIQLIEEAPIVALVEAMEFKRRWSWEPWEKQQERALREWLQDRLEARELWFEGAGDQERAVCRSVAQLTDRVLATDPEFLDVARLWKGGVEIDPVQVVAELVADEHVPAQSGARYKGKGFDKRRQWERTWELQKLEDDGLPLPDGLERIPVPPKYASGEFAKASYWRHRGKLDVPKERFTSIWGAESAADPTMVLAWAGFDHVQLTQAIGALLVDRQATDGWDADRSWPLVVAMAEQLFWLDLWHHEHDPRWGDSPANLFRSMVTEQAHRGGRTPADVPDWRAPAPTRGRKKKDGA